MSFIEILRIILLVLLIFCAVSVNLTRNLLAAVVIFMSYSSVMCVIWILMESPDLAITEAAVGAGISGVLFLMTLKKIKAVDAGETGLVEDQGEKAFRRKLTGSTPGSSLGGRIIITGSSSGHAGKGSRKTGRTGSLAGTGTSAKNTSIKNASVKNASGKGTAVKSTGSKVRRSGGKGRT